MCRPSGSVREVEVGTIVRSLAIAAVGGVILFTALGRDDGPVAPRSSERQPSELRDDRWERRQERLANSEDPDPIPTPPSREQPSGSAGGRPPAMQTNATVERVVDGDTIEVTTGGSEEDARLLGIDTPEVYGGNECGGREASDYMSELLPPGTRILLTPDSTQDDRDRYGRLLRYADTPGRGDVGELIVAAGWAEPYVYEVPVARSTSYRSAAAQARAQERGVWSACGGF
jgi:endonuclease YncB( thermonuclease family)